MSKQLEAWTAFVSNLSPKAKASLDPTAEEDVYLTPTTVAQIPASTEDDNDAYTRFIAKLSPTAKSQLVEPVLVVGPKENVKAGASRWGLVETLDGEWSKLRVFRSAEALVKRLQQLEGKDVVAWCFYGLALPVTKGPQRYLQLPDGQFMQIPLYAGGPATILPTEALGNIIFEETGFLGPPELAETGLPELVEAEESDS